MLNPNDSINVENLISEFKIVFINEFNEYIASEVNRIENINGNYLLSFGSDFSSSINIKQNSIIINFLKERNLEDCYVGNVFGGFKTNLVGILNAFTTDEKQEIQEKLINVIKEYNNKIISSNPKL